MEPVIKKFRHRNVGSFLKAQSLTENGRINRVLDLHGIVGRYRELTHMMLPLIHPA